MIESLEIASLLLGYIGIPVAGLCTLVGLLALWLNP